MRIFILALFLGFSSVSCAHLDPLTKEQKEGLGFAEAKVVMAKTVKLTPGDWQGYCLGPMKQSAVYLPELSFVGAAPDGFAIQRMMVQREYNVDKKKWYDVLRVQTPEQAEQPLKVHIRVLRVDADAAKETAMPESEDGSCCN